MCAKQQKKHHPSAREIAYLALLAAKREEAYIADTLDIWIKEANPSVRDAGLAREIAYGVCRMGLALDAMAGQYTTSGKLSLKLKERLLMQCALYQYFYLQRIPLYAIANETLELARKYTHAQFIKFLNAMLRRLEEFAPQLPSGMTVHDLSIRYSYPPFFIEKMLQAYGVESTVSVLEAGNLAAPTVFRMRSSRGLEDLSSNAYTILEGTDNQMAVLHSSADLSKVSESPNYYIQNATPAVLMGLLKKEGLQPDQLLDLCAAPGGKLLLGHDLFPKAALHANDVSEQKIQRLQENICKYGLDVTLTCGPGEDLQVAQRFDLIILDAPCSNTGVLNKRPEARWRLSQAGIQENLVLQRKLLKHAAAMLAEGGEVWYLTCSILPEENEELVHQACKELGLIPRLMKTILPNAAGWDGGFGCALQRA